MTDPIEHRTSGEAAPMRPRGRRWRRWILATFAALVVIVFVSVFAYSSLPAPAPLALPVAAASAPVGELDGTWVAAAGSEAGFRIQQTILGMNSDIVGRTNDVRGSVVISGGQVSSATFEVDLTSIESNGKVPPQLGISLETSRFPTATIALGQPVPLSADFGSGAPMTATVTAMLGLRGTSHPVTLTVAARRDGSQLELAGSIPVAFSAWSIPDPTGYGWLGSVADHATAEFLVVLDREAALR